MSQVAGHTNLQYQIWNIMSLTAEIAEIAECVYPSSAFSACSAVRLSLHPQLVWLAIYDLPRAFE
jgi:hypothetical protein